MDRCTVRLLVQAQPNLNLVSDPSVEVMIIVIVIVVVVVVVVAVVVVVSRSSSSSSRPTCLQATQTNLRFALDVATHSMQIGAKSRLSCHGTATCRLACPRLCPKVIADITDIVDITDIMVTDIKAEAWSTS